MKNQKKGNFFSVIGALLSFSTIIFWLGKFANVSYMTEGYHGNQFMKEHIRVFDVVATAPIFNFISAILTSVIVISIICLFLSIKNFRTADKNEHLKTFTLSLINIIAIIVLLFVLNDMKLSLSDDPENYNFSIKLTFNGIMLFTCLLSGTILSFIGYIQSIYGTEKVTDIAKTLENFRKLLKDGVIVETEYEMLRKETIQKLIK